MFWQTLQDLFGRQQASIGVPVLGVLHITQVDIPVGASSMGKAAAIAEAAALDIANQ